MLTLRLFTAILFIHTAVHGQVVTFKSDIGSFQIEFVPIGNAGNLDDDRIDFSPESGVSYFIGGVNYEFSMAKHEISCEAFDVVSDSGGFEFEGDFCRDGNTLGFGDIQRGMEFANWLNTSAGYHAAYKINDGIWKSGELGYYPTGWRRNAFARFFIASSDEFHKAAFYDPATKSYLDYSTGTNEPPEAVPSGTAPNTIVANGLNPKGAPVEMAGGLSAYGTMGQIGNGSEMDESGSRIWVGGESPVVPFDLASRPDRTGVHSFRIVSHLKVDTNGNDLVDLGDVDGLSGSLRTDLFTFLEIVPGDLDGVNGVEFADFLSLSDNFGTPGGYADGDIDGDGNVAFPDFLILSDNFGKGAAHAVPEPSSLHLLICGAVFGFLRRRRCDRGYRGSYISRERLCL